MENNGIKTCGGVAVLLRKFLTSETTQRQQSASYIGNSVLCEKSPVAITG
jgi:hypothetical protein